MKKIILMTGLFMVILAHSVFQIWLYMRPCEQCVYIRLAFFAMVLGARQLALALDVEGPHLVALPAQQVRERLAVESAAVLAKPPLGHTYAMTKVLLNGNSTRPSLRVVYDSITRWVSRSSAIPGILPAVPRKTRKPMRTADAPSHLYHPAIMSISRHWLKITAGCGFRRTGPGVLWHRGFSTGNLTNVRT